MDICDRVAQMSYANRHKVGAVIVKDGNIIAFGWNGTPPGDDNCCETKDGGVTRPDVIHAEQNAIAKAARLGISTKGAALFTTLSPCFDCAKLILQSGISSVYYKEMYRDKTAYKFLKQHNVRLIHQHDSK